MPRSKQLAYHGLTSRCLLLHTSVLLVLATCHVVQAQPTFDECKMFMAASDTNRDQLLDRETEYIRFVNLISRRYYGPTFTSFETLDPSLQSNYDRLAPSSNGDIDISGSFPGSSVTEEQSLNLSDICDETSEALRTLSTTSAPTESSLLDSVPAPSPTGLVLQSSQISLDCRRSIVGSDSNRDGFIGEYEYTSFVNRLSSNAYTHVTFFSDLPQVIKSNFNSLATSGQVDIFGAAPSEWPQASPHQRSFLQKLCLQTEFSIQSAASMPKNTTLTLAQTAAPIPATSSPATVGDVPAPSPSTNSNSTDGHPQQDDESPQLNDVPGNNISIDTNGTSVYITTNATSLKEEVGQQLAGSSIAAIVAACLLFLMLLYFGLEKKGWLPRYLSFGFNHNNNRKFPRFSRLRWKKFRFNLASRMPRRVGPNRVKTCLDESAQKECEDLEACFLKDKESFDNEDSRYEIGSQQEGMSAKLFYPYPMPGMDDLDSHHSKAPSPSSKIDDTCKKRGTKAKLANVRGRETGQDPALGKLVVCQPTEIEESQTDLDHYAFDDDQSERTHQSGSTTMSLYCTTQNPATISGAPSENEDDLLEFFEKSQGQREGESTTMSTTEETHEHLDRSTISLSDKGLQRTRGNRKVEENTRVEEEDGDEDEEDGDEDEDDNDINNDEQEEEADSSSEEETSLPSMSKDGVTSVPDSHGASDTDQRQILGHQRWLLHGPGSKARTQQQHESEERPQHVEPTHQQEIDPELLQQIEELVEEAMPNGKDKINSMMMQYQGREEDLVHTLQRLKVRMGSHQTSKVQTLIRPANIHTLGMRSRLSLSSVTAECAVIAAAAATNSRACESEQECAASLMSVSETSRGLLETSDEEDDQEFFSEDDDDESSVEMTLESSFDVDSDYEQDESARRRLLAMPKHFPGPKKNPRSANRMPAELNFPGI